MKEDNAVMVQYVRLRRKELRNGSIPLIILSVFFLIELQAANRQSCAKFILG